MKKNKCLFKLLGMMSALAMIFSVSVPNDGVGAISSTEIIEDCARYRLRLSAEENAFIDQCNIDSYYSFIENIEVAPYVSGFRSEHKKNKEAIDSVDFLFFINFINRANVEFDKELLIKRLISLRDVEECRNDRFYVTDFDTVFGTNLKVLLKKYSPKTLRPSKGHKGFRD